jgi:hypothetical protein
MSRPSIDPIWIDYIRTAAAHNLKLGAEKIRGELERKKRRGEIPESAGSVPSRRKISNVLQEFRDLPREEKQPYDVFKFPESMQAAVLPWEASRACLDLLAWQYKENRDRPLVGLAQCFWQITQAAPDADIQTRLEISSKLRLSEIIGCSGEFLRGLEWFLAYAPWRNERNKVEYEKAVNSHTLPSHNLKLKYQQLTPEILEVVQSFARISPGARRQILGPPKKIKKSGGKFGGTR